MHTTILTSQNLTPNTAFAKTGDEAGTHEGPKPRVLSERHRLKKCCETKYDTERYKSSTTRTENAPKRILISKIITQKTKLSQK
jgi:hypothetical protein